MRVLHADLLRCYLAELSRQGNNLNQIAKALNAGVAPGPETLLAAVGAMQAPLHQLMLAILDALGVGHEP